MRTPPRYSYNPPPSRSDWLENLRPLITAPTAYITFAAGIGLALFLLSYRDFSISRYGAHILILLIAFPIHELSHALVADRLGDPTPRQHGRITLNPFAQLNLVGSLLMLFVGLGWAYVPISPRYLRPNPRTGHMIVAAAGPISNLVLALVCAVLWQAALPALQLASATAIANYIYRILFFFAYINLALFFFNLVPIAPLDGFTVLKGLLPYDLAYRLEGMQRYGMLLFLAFFFIAPLLGLPLLDWLIFNPAQSIASFLFFES
ncbi:MAG: site-2 protease family protein [Anaerolineaceae bacterium]|nr:site-2 protease family protein [Anaerolineaceae bacterium]MCB9100476.1 site-2 protease family protein [Anaerolineales bacterium]